MDTHLFTGTVIAVIACLINVIVYFNNKQKTAEQKAADKAATNAKVDHLNDSFKDDIQEIKEMLKEIKQKHDSSIERVYTRIEKLEDAFRNHLATENRQ